MERNVAKRDDFFPILHVPEYMTAMDIVVEELHDELDRIAQRLLEDEHEETGGSDN